MSNIIKIPLASNPGRSFKLQALAEEATWTSAIGTLTAGTAVVASVVGGSGSGAVASIEITGAATLADVAATITSADSGS